MGKITKLTDMNVEQYNKVEEELTTTQTFTKEQICSSMIVDMDYHIDKDSMLPRLRHTLSGYILSQTVDKKEVTYTLPKPSFLDWLLGRKKSVVVTISAKDVLLNPPAIPEKTFRMYSFNPEPLTFYRD